MHNESVTSGKISVTQQKQMLVVVAQMQLVFDASRPHQDDSPTILIVFYPPPARRLGKYIKRCQKIFESPTATGVGRREGK